MNQLNYSVEVFSGPLDLLLQLIAKNKINIYDIPISFLLEQYLAHVEEMEKLDTEVAEEFIVMAAELLLIKSRMLLPKPPKDGEEIDPREALRLALLEYKRIKELSQLLTERFSHFSLSFTKKQEEIEPPDEDFSGQDVNALAQFMRTMVTRAELHQQEITSSPAQAALAEIVTKRVIPIQQRVFGLLRQLLARGEVDYETFLIAEGTRSGAVASFAAVLQLMATDRVTLDDERLNPRIVLKRRVARG